MMDKEDSYIFLKIRKRPWYIWLFRCVWLLWLIVWGDMAVGSWEELEPRAFILSLLIFLISLIAGFLIWLWGYIRFRKSQV